MRRRNPTGDKREGERPLEDHFAARIGCEQAAGAVNDEQGRCRAFQEIAGRLKFQRRAPHGRLDTDRVPDMRQQARQQ